MKTIPDMSINPSSDFVLPSLSPHQTARLLKRAEQVLTHHHKMLSKSGRNILHHTLERKRKHIRFKHYPQGDRIDKETGGQYFYHCHREDVLREEHGHFHCFLRQHAIPQSIRPKALKDWDKYQDNPMTHLVAIAMNRLGQPIRLFTVNRWVTEETWYSARHMSALCKRFKMNVSNNEHWQTLDQWVEGMIHLFHPQITWLHQQRDMYINTLKKKNPILNLYEAKEYEELSSIQIDLATQIQWLMEQQVVHTSS